MRYVLIFHWIRLRITKGIILSGFLPINYHMPKPISGKQLSLRIRITHNRYLDIGTVFRGGKQAHKLETRRAYE